jgi:hypothetical protein
VVISSPLGDVADPATAISIKEAARQVIACFNAQDLPRAAAVMTDSGVQHVFWGLSSSASAREATKARLTAPAQPRDVATSTRLLTVTDVSWLPDGRIAAFVIVNDPALPPPGPEALLGVFAHQNDTWLLDDLVRFVIVPPVSSATPTPAT